MTLLTVRLDAKELIRSLSNSVDYSYGFFEGIEQEKLSFNRTLGGYVVEALEKYIDARARANPQSLHHMYEWGAVGNDNARLFKFNVNATRNFISFNGKFLQSKVPSPTSNEAFSDKASIMENNISIIIEPKNSEVLVFETDGETVFTTKSIFIEHPGGDEVAGSFGRTVDSFFGQYFTNALLKPLIFRLERAEEYTNNFKAGTTGGRLVGVRAGRQYFILSGVTIE